MFRRPGLFGVELLHRKFAETATFGDEWETFENLSFYKTIKISAGAVRVMNPVMTAIAVHQTPAFKHFFCLLAHDFEF